MKLYEACKLHQGRGKWTLMVYGPHVRALEVNETFAVLWQHFYGKAFSEEDVQDYLVSFYGLSRSEACSETAQIVELWQTQELLLP